MDIDPGTLPVTVKGFTWAAAGNWTLVALIGGTIAAIVRAIGLPRLAELVFNRNKDLRAEQREAEVTADAQIAELQAGMQRANGAIAFLANAVTTAVNALTSDDPAFRARAAGQTKELVAMAVSTLGDKDPFAKSLERLAMPGVKGYSDAE